MKPDPIDWLNTEDSAAWFRAVELEVHSAISAGLDATMPPLRRVLTRREARRRILDARKALARLFYAARRPV